MPDLIKFKAKHELKLISIADLIEYRHTRDKLVEHVLTQDFESEFGTFDLHIFTSILDDRQHLALSMGKLDKNPTLVRVQSENLLGDIFRSKSVGGHNSLSTAMQRIAEAGHGVLLYIEQAQGGIRVIEDLEDDGHKKLGPAKMDFRDYGIGAQILVELGLKQIRLISSTHRKVVGLDGYDLEIIEQIEI